MIPLVADAIACGGAPADTFIALKEGKILHQQTHLVRRETHRVHVCYGALPANLSQTPLCDNSLPRKKSRSRKEKT
jgi:hypothetical protein